MYRFGEGYTLVIRVADSSESNMTTVEEQVSLLFPHSKLIDKHCAQLTFKLSSGRMNVSDAFKAIQVVFSLDHS